VNVEGCRTYPAEFLKRVGRPHAHHAIRIAKASPKVTEQLRPFNQSPRDNVRLANGSPVSPSQHQRKFARQSSFPQIFFTICEDFGIEVDLATLPDACLDLIAGPAEAPAERPNRRATSPP